jgi:hypothetical protein
MNAHPIKEAFASTATEPVTARDVGDVKPISSSSLSAGSYSAMNSARTGALVSGGNSDHELTSSQLFLLGSNQEVIPSCPSNDIQRQLHEQTASKAGHLFELSDIRNTSAFSAMEREVAANKNVANFVEVKYNTERQFSQLLRETT